MRSKLYIAIPLLDELDHLQSILDCIRSQRETDYHVIICVNQPDEWWNDPGKADACARNRSSLEFLEKVKDIPMTLIDRTSPGNGWQGKKHGVGMARKTIMDAALERSGSEIDIIISLDGDTNFGPRYFSSIRENFENHPEALAISVPYYHDLTGNERTDRAILRYEIYMRHYLLNLFRIGSPYAFTALGSAIAFTAGAYRKIGGMTPVLSGEDFYFLQKLAKAGEILTWNEERVFPAARFSDRVYFGTGPAMIRGDKGDWTTYPVYDPGLFDDIRLTYELFPSLYEQDQPTPMDQFLSSVFPGKEIWQPLRENTSNVDSFVKACHQKIDGLRILQYLKSSQKEAGHRDEYHMNEFLQEYHPEEWEDLKIPADFRFDRSDIKTLNRIRDTYSTLTDKECKEHYKTGLPTLLSNV